MVGNLLPTNLLSVTTEKDRKALLSRLEKVMAAKGWKAYVWSKKAGLSQSHVGGMVRKLEAGIDPNPKSHTWDALASIAGYSTAWLERGVGPEERSANSVDPTPPPSPVSETRVTDDAMTDIVNAGFDASRGHLPADSIVVTEAMRSAAALLRDNLEPGAFARMMFDAVVYARSKGRKITAAELPYVALGEVNDQLTHEREKLAQMKAQSQQWADQHGVTLRAPGDLHPAAEKALRGEKGTGRRR